MKTKVLIFEFLCLADQYYYYIARGRIMLHVSGKDAQKQIYPSIASHGWDQNENIFSIEEPFPKDIEEILISEEYNANEVDDEEGEINNETDTF